MVVWSILILFFYQHGNKLDFIRDHEALRYVLNLADSPGRLACWSLFRLRTTAK